MLADQTPWVFHTWMLTMACLSIALADHEAPRPPAHPLAFPTGSDSLGPHLGAQVR